MRIIFFCPPAVRICGGIKYILLLAESLQKQGYEVCVFEEQKRRPEWFPSTVPIVGQEIFKPNPDEVLVLPEDQPQILKTFKDWPQKKVLYAQNQFYGCVAMNGDGEGTGSYKDFGISHALCSSQSLNEYFGWRHPDIQRHLLPYSIDTSVFYPRPEQEKEKQIVFMPRKRPIEAAFIKDLFTYRYPEYKDWQWVRLDEMTESETAEIMGKAKVFLSLSRLESFGLTPVEAMASGCVVAGFTGLGGREYADQENGFWAEEDDFETCCDQLAKACGLASAPEGDLAKLAYDKEVQKTLAKYTPSIFDEAAKRAFQEII